MSDNNERLVLSGTAYFASVHSMNTMSNSYKMDLSISKETVNY